MGYSCTGVEGHVEELEDTRAEVRRLAKEGVVPLGPAEPVHSHLLRKLRVQPQPLAARQNKHGPLPLGHWPRFLEGNPRLLQEPLPPLPCV